MYSSQFISKLREHICVKLINIYNMLN